MCALFLCVTVPPVISSRGGTVTVVVNDAVRLECEATGVPVPSITWLKDGSPVASVSYGIQVPMKSIYSCLTMRFFCTLQILCDYVIPDCHYTSLL